MLARPGSILPTRSAQRLAGHCPKRVLLRQAHTRQPVPRCQRIHEHYSAGFLILKDSCSQAHREEIMPLLRNHEQREQAEQTLERIMDIEGLR